MWVQGGTQMNATKHTTYIDRFLDGLICVKAAWLNYYSTWCAAYDDNLVYISFGVVNEICYGS